MKLRSLMKAFLIGVLTGGILEGVYAQEASQGFIEYKSGKSAEITIQQYSSSDSLPNQVGQESSPLIIKAEGDLTVKIQQGESSSPTKGNQVIRLGDEITSNGDLTFTVSQLGNSNIVKLGKVSSSGDLNLTLKQDSGNSNSGNEIELKDLTLGGGSLSVKQIGSGNKFTFKNSTVGQVDGEVVEDGNNNTITLDNLTINGTLTLKNYDESGAFTIDGDSNSFTAQNVTANNLKLLATITGSGNSIDIGQETALDGDITNKFKINGDQNTIAIAEISVAGGNNIIADFNLSGDNITVAGATKDKTLDLGGIRQTSYAGPSYLEVIAGDSAIVGVTQLNASEVDPSSGYSNYAYIKTAANTTVIIYQDARNSGYNRISVENSNPEVKVVQDSAGTHVYP